jgi:hypothetical protein
LHLLFELTKSVSDDSVWDLFKRHNRTKKVPRQSHPQSDKEAQEEYKKIPELSVSKSLDFKAPQDKRPIQLFFQNEARFGRIDNLTSCRVPEKCRAQVGNQIIREYTYAYRAACPQTGETFSLILPYANEVCMDIFMRELSQAYKDYRIIMAAMDRASWHTEEKAKNGKIACLCFSPPNHLN